MEKAILLDQNNVEYLNELASQKLSQEKVKDAIKCYMNALRKEETNMTALLGRLKCQIMEEKLDEVEKQFELLTEALPNISSNPVSSLIRIFIIIIKSIKLLNLYLKEFPYLKAILNKKKNTSEKNVKLIDESITCHFKALKVLYTG